ncbi:MAG: hypothetical protein JF591_21115 [Lysobacter sp.]|nr:hypothetical protein [Lysobacter sp.]
MRIRISSHESAESVLPDNIETAMTSMTNCARSFRRRGSFADADRCLGFGIKPSSIRNTTDANPTRRATLCRPTDLGRRRSNAQSSARADEPPGHRADRNLRYVTVVSAVAPGRAQSR